MKIIYYFTALLIASTLVVSCSNENDKTIDNSHEGHDHTSSEHDHDEHDHDGHDHGDHKEHAKVDFPVDGYTFYGMEEVNPKEAITVEEMIETINTTGTFEGNVSAVLDGVCKKMGCWVTIVNKYGASIRVRFKDHEFGVPTETPVATSVVLKGIGSVDTVSVEMQKHYLDDAKEAGQEVSQEEYDNITEDLIDYSFISNGILVKK